MDQTIINSEIGKDLRKQGKWENVFKRIHEFKPYPGIVDIMSLLINNHCKLAIVTSNPFDYCKKILELWHIPITISITSDDVTNLKPHPEPFIKITTALGLSSYELISIGDQAKDIISSHKANIKTIAALWGTKDSVSLLAANPDYQCSSVEELKILLSKIILNKE